MNKSREIIAPTQPGPDQLEVSIFGPGKGEAIAVHLGGGTWMTVDSCKDVGTGVHPVLRYFDDIGVDVATQVALVVGTHAHDDHVSGISSLFAAAKAAKFVTSAAITSREFFATVEMDADIEKQTGVTVRGEYRRLFEEIERRGRSPVGLKPFTHAVEQMPIYQRSSKGLPECRVVALSPSHEAITRSLMYLAEGTAKANQRRRLSDADPNEFAIAIWVDLGGVTVLLGADILNGPVGCGWEAVLATHNPSPPGSLYKVAHHGSPTSHHPRVWDEMLVDGVLSLIAPYRSGQKPLPGPEDAQRIRERSGEAYITAGPKIPTPTAQVKAARSKLMGIASNVREPEGRSGHVRARWDEQAQRWAVDLGWPAEGL